MIYRIWACLLVCLFFAQASHAKIIKDEHYITSSYKYSWKEACRFLTKRDSPLIAYKSVDSLDCMGKTVKVISFCDDKQVTNPYFTRAIVSNAKKQVICQSAKRVILKWECEGKEDKYCVDPEVGCFLFKERLARRLKLVHHSITDKKYLNCYFEYQNNKLNLNI
jgi:hypothetical protein